MKNKIINNFILLSTLIGFAGAQSIDLNGKNIILPEDEVVMQGGLSSLQHIDKKKYNDGIFVDVKYQYAVIAEAADKDIDIEKAIAMIVKSGYEVKTVFTNRTGEKIETRKIESKKDEK